MVRARIVLSCAKELAGHSRAQFVAPRRNQLTAELRPNYSRTVAYFPTMESHRARLAREAPFAKARAFQIWQSFTKITADRIRSGSFQSVAALQQAARNYAGELKENRKHFDQTTDTDFKHIKRVCERTFDLRH